MNGIHDMGGMDGFGSVQPEENEPVFHEPWEGRVYALAVGGLGRWGQGRNWGSFRFELESIPPADYLRMSYYERWFTMIVNRLTRSELVTEAELDSGYRDPDLPQPEVLPATGEGLGSGLLDLDITPRFRADAEVRARNLHPRGHTRLPRYTRGKRGTVIRDNGVYALQDTDETGQRLGDLPQHVYTVRFTSQELWGDRGESGDFVYVDMWESYLETV